MAHSVPRFFLGSTLLLLAPLALFAQDAPTLKVHSEDHQSVKARISYEIRTSHFIVTRWTAFLPEPPELPSQTGLVVSTSPNSVVVSELSSLGRKVRLIDGAVFKPVAGGKLSLVLDVQATLRTRKLVPLRKGEQPPRVAPLSKAETASYTAASPSIDFHTKAFETWLDKKGLRAKNGESPTELAERVLTVIRLDYKYLFRANKKLASSECTKTSTDCGGMSLVFVAALRANKIPARTLVGRLAKPRNPKATPGDLAIDWPHVRAEFHLAGVGWVAVDPSYANADRSKPVKHFIGHDPGDLLVLHIDFDLKLRYADQVRVCDVLQLGPHYRAYGRGKFDATFGPTGWELTATPVEK